MKKLKRTISLFATAAIAAGLFPASVSADGELTPLVFDRTHNAAAYTTEILNEDFSDYTPESAYSTDKLTVGLDIDGDGVAASATVKKDPDGNQYLNVATKESSGWDVHFTKNFSQTTNSVLFGFDYRAVTGGIAFYSGSAGVNGEVQSSGTVLTHRDNGSWKQVGAAITTTENGSSRWVSIKMLIIPTQQIIHFYIDNQYHGTADYRLTETAIKQLWIGFQGTDKSADIDNISIVNLGTDDDTWYRFDETDKLTFDYDAQSNPDGTVITPLVIGNASGCNSDSTSGVISSDGTFKMKKPSATGDARQYKYVLDGAISTRYSKMSFKYKIDTTDTDTTSRIDIYTGSGAIGSTLIYKSKVLSTFFLNSNPPAGLSSGNSRQVFAYSDATADENGWHTMEMIFDMENNTIQYVHDGSVYSTVTYNSTTYNIGFRTDAESLANIWFRFMPGADTAVAYIDDLTFYKDGTEYLAPSIQTDLEIDTSSRVITLTEAQADSYTIDSIKGAFTVGEGVAVTVTDADADGKVSEGDTITFTSAMDVDYVYTIAITENLELTAEALIVKGSDGQGDDFSYADTITKAGSAFIECRLKNNTETAAAPTVLAAAYDDNGKMLSADFASGQTIGAGEHKDYELSASIPSGASGAKLKIMVWESLSSQSPVKDVKEYTIDTDDFTVPTVISDNMVLQRNSVATIFGKAPEGATVTAALEDGTSATYTVPSGSNEFFAELELDEYNAEGQTLTVSAVDRNGIEIGTITRTGVLIGDVYYGGGQSNMQRTFNGTANEIGLGMSQIYTADEKAEFVSEFKALADKLGNVRYFLSQSEQTMYSRASQGAEALASKEVWKTVTSDNIGNMCEVLIRMAGNLVDTEGDDVPIGIISCSQGGTKITKWISRDALFDSGVFDGSVEITEYENNVTNTSAPERWAGTTDLYYDGVRALMPYGIKAAVWYQGESSTFNGRYDEYLKVMIDEFREGMHNPDMPYIVIQLPGYVIGKWSEGVNTATNFDSALSSTAWPMQRLCQWNVGEKLSNVYMVVTNDTGDNTNIHPANKAEISQRLARTVLSKVHGRTDIACEGPEFEEITAKSAGTITFTTTQTVTAYGDEDITDYSLFEVSADGTTWYEIDKDGLSSGDSVTVNGNSVTVTTSQTTDTINYVRYAYTPAVVKYLYNSYTDAAGDIQLPLAPFDTSYSFNELN